MNSKIKIKKTGHKFAPGFIAEIEKLIGQKIPQDYLDFLEIHNGGIPEANMFNIPNTNNGNTISEFIGVEGIISEKKRMMSRLKSKVIPIAYAGGGNLICISLEEGFSGVYYWDHELESNEGEPPSWANMFFLSKSFSEFLNMLNKFDPSSVRLKPGQVKKAWIDPEFLKQVQKEPREQK